MTKETVSAGGVVINKHGQVLVVNQRGNSWSLPKGHMDEGESLLEAARREIYEESGIHRLRFVGELGSYRRSRIGKYGGVDKREMKTLHFFVFRTDQVKLAPVDKDNPEALWVDVENVAALLTHPRDKKYFRDNKVTIRNLVRS
jgi:8-oxo-dGTP pyrophosphatase MutT (NUDIX family)